MGRPLIHPRMLDSLRRAGVFRHVCEIQTAAPDAQNSIGEAAPAYTSLLAGIPCAVSQYENRKGDEIRTPETTYASRGYHIALVGFYPQITEKMRAVVTDPAGSTTTYNILSVVSDSQLSRTKLFAQVIQ